MLYKDEFSTIGEFYDYIRHTPTNNTFRYVEDLPSMIVSKHRLDMTDTRNITEAYDLLLKGDIKLSAQLNSRLNAAIKNIKPNRVSKNVLSVSGYQSVVPLYLSGVPTNMLDRRMVPKKEKVLNITKNISYKSTLSVDEIMDEGEKLLTIVKKLEVLGYRVKLSIAVGVCSWELDNTKIICKICVKKPDDRINVSKLAFPVVHPSMVRRLIFRYLEVNPNVTVGFLEGYGKIMQNSELGRYLKGDVVIPPSTDFHVEHVNNLNDLMARI